MISAVQEASTSTRLTVPKRVLSWWWSMLRTLLPLSLQEVHRHAVDVAAVEEDHHPVGHVGRRLVEDLLERHEAVLDRQRELLRRQEHHRVLAQRPEDLVHGQQGAERVAVRVLVGGEQEAVARRGSPRRPARGPSSPVRGSVISSSRRERRAPRSTLSSYWKVRVGVRFIRSSAAIRPWRKPWADSSPSSVCSRSASVPSTLT